MAVITISSELGSGGRDIAAQVAQALGYACANKDTTDEILRLYGLTRFNDLYSTAPSILDMLNADNLLLVSMANEILEAVAIRGRVVIHGRTGFAVLAGYADVLHVRIQAPLAARVQRVMAREGLSDLPAAEALVREDDAVHRAYVQRFYNQQWDEPSNFDLSIDTGTVAIDEAAQQIVAAARGLDQKTVGAGATITTRIKVDPVLADAVARVMG
jgi:cytidylate kinase